MVNLDAQKFYDRQSTLSKVPILSRDQMEVQNREYELAVSYTVKVRNVWGMVGVPQCHEEELETKVAAVHVVANSETVSASTQRGS